MEEKDLSENILKLIKDTKGLGIKSALKLFEECEALTEELQIVAVTELIDDSDEIIKVKRKGIYIDINKKELSAFEAANWSAV